MDQERWDATVEQLLETGSAIAEGRAENQWGDLDADDAPERVLWDFGVTVDPGEAGHGAMLVEPQQASYLFEVFYGRATRN